MCQSLEFWRGVNAIPVSCSVISSAPTQIFVGRPARNCEFVTFRDLYVRFCTKFRPNSFANFERVLWWRQVQCYAYFVLNFFQIRSVISTVASGDCWSNVMLYFGLNFFQIRSVISNLGYGDCWSNFMLYFVLNFFHILSVISNLAYGDCRSNVMLIFY